MESLKKTPSSTRSRNATKTQGILVLGMHRSGTSACTRLLNLLGCALAEEIYGAAEGNENGHWESVAAVTLNDEILNSAGSRWDDWGPINADWRASSMRAEMTERAGEVIRDHAKLGPLFALKDPRLCRLADVWLDAMEDAKVEPLVLTMLRNPVEVTQSLENRDLMSQGYGSLLWLRHVLDAEYLSRGKRRLYVNYDQLLDNWPDVIDRIKTGFGVSFPRNSPAVHDEIDSFLTRKHQHHQQPAEAVHKTHASSDWLRRTWAIFLAWSQNGEDPADHEALDDIRREFDRSYGTFARLLMHNDLSGEYAAASQLRNQLSTTIAEAEQAAALAEAAKQEADSKLQTQAEQEVTLRADLAAAARRSSELETELAELRTKEPVLAAEIATLQASLKDAGDKASTLEAEMARLQGETERLGERETELETELAALRTKEPVLTAEIVTLQASLKDAGDKASTLEEEMARLRGETERLGERETQLEAELAALRTKELEAASRMAELLGTLRRAQSDALTERERRQETEQLLAAKDAAFIEATEQSAQYLGQLSVAQSTLAQRAEEIAQMSAELLKASTAEAAANAATAFERERREAAEARLATAENQVLDLQSKLDQQSTAHSAASDKLAAEVTLMARLLLDENKALSSAQSALDSATNELAARQQENAGLAERLHELELTAKRAEQARSDAETKLSKQVQDIARLTTMLASETQRVHQAELQAKTAQNELTARTSEETALTEKIRQIELRASSAEASRFEAERKLATRFSEVARLTSMLSEEATRAQAAEANKNWLREVARVSRKFPKWWALMPAGWRRKREYERYGRHDLFDPEQYFALNSDVAQSGMDPLTHYILHGLEEGRRWRA